MKITFISPPPNLSGGHRVKAIYADRLAQRGHDVTVVAQARPIQSPRTRFASFLKKRAFASPLRESHYDRMTAARLQRLQTPGPVTADDVPDADVVIATWWETAFMVAQFPPSKGRKFYFVQHHEVFDHLPKHLSAASYILPLKKITIASWLKDTMQREYGDDDVALVPNSVDHTLFFAPARQKQSVPTVGLMYSTSPFKGVDVALKVIESARTRHPNLKVIAFGHTTPRPHLPLPEGTEFHLRPEQQTLRQLYASCDVFLLASRQEGFGLPVLEAMACRTPVVATRTGCAPDVIRNGVNGFLAPIDDATALAEGLCDALSLAPEAWQAMSDAAWQTTHDYTWDDATALFEAQLLEREAS